MATPLLELRNVTKVFQSGIRKTAASTTIALRDASLITAPSDDVHRSTTLTLANGTVRRIEGWI